MLKAHLKTLTSYGCASSKQQGELSDKVMSRHLTNSHVIDENRHQNNVNTTKCFNAVYGIKGNVLRLGSSNVGILSRDMYS